MSTSDKDIDGKVGFGVLRPSSGTWDCRRAPQGCPSGSVSRTGGYNAAGSDM